MLPNVFLARTETAVACHGVMQESKGVEPAVLSTTLFLLTLLIPLVSTSSIPFLRLISGGKRQAWRGWNGYSPTKMEGPFAGNSQENKGRLVIEIMTTHLPRMKTLELTFHPHSLPAHTTPSPQSPPHSLPAHTTPCGRAGSVSVTVKRLHNDVGQVGDVGKQWQHLPIVSVHCMCLSPCVSLDREITAQILCHRTWWPGIGCSLFSNLRLQICFPGWTTFSHPSSSLIEWADGLFPLTFNKGIHQGSFPQVRMVSWPWERMSWGFGRCCCFVF